MTMMLGPSKGVLAGEFDAPVDEGKKGKGHDKADGEAPEAKASVDETAAAPAAEAPAAEAEAPAEAAPRC